MQFFRQVKNLSCYIRGWNRCTFKISWIQQNTIQSECFSKSSVFLGEDPLLQRCYHMDFGEMDHAVLVDITGSIVLVSFLEVMSLQLIWRSGNHLQVPHLQMSCGNLSIMRGNQDHSPSNAHQSNMPYLNDPRFTHKHYCTLKSPCSGRVATPWQQICHAKTIVWSWQSLYCL